MELVGPSSSDKANSLLDQFCSVFTKTSSSTIDTSHIPQSPDIPPLHITSQGIEKLLRDLKVNKACGLDGILNQVLKNCASELASGISIIF